MGIDDNGMDRLEKKLQGYTNKLKTIVTDYGVMVYDEFEGADSGCRFYTSPYAVFEKGKVELGFTLDHCNFNVEARNGKLHDVRVKYKFYITITGTESQPSLHLSNYNMTMYWLISDEDFVGMGGKGAGDKAFQTEIHFCLPKREILRDVIQKHLKIPVILPQKCDNEIHI